jgi:hypothetical protein
MCIGDLLHLSILQDCFEYATNTHLTKSRQS